MPPPSPPSESQDLTAYEQAPLSDEDVGILHSIITAAQELPQAARFPFRALFEAYHNVLRAHGLDPDHDPLYFRYLLRIGAVEGNGPLLQKFEVLLAELGIRLEFDEAQRSPDITRDLDAPGSVSDGQQSRPRSAHGRSRRASFSSFEDARRGRRHVSAPSSDAGYEPQARASEGENRHHEMLITAITHDQETLLRQALDTWRSKFEERRRRRETKRFFAVLGRRAKKARNLYLLTKAFTHWAQCTSDEAQRKALLRKFVARWKERSRAAVARQQMAERFRIAKLVRRTVTVLVTQVRFAAAKYRVDAMADRRVLRSTFLTWLERMRMERHAAEVSRARILRSTLCTWTERTRMTRAADEFKREKTMRHALRSWNESLRFQSLSMRIDQRVALQALYRWILAERQILLRRILDQRLRQQMMRRMVDKARTLRVRLSQAETTVQESRDRRTKAAVLSRWQLQLQLDRKRQHLAFEFHAPRPLQDTLERWTARLQHVQQLERDSKKAEYYLLATKTLKAWHAAVAASKRQKRKAAYAVMRRKFKMNCARNALNAWRERTAHVGDLAKAADDMYRNHVVLVGMEHFDRWRARREELAEMATQAQGLRQKNMLRRITEAWQSRLRQQRELEAQAAYRANMRVVNVAAAALRKLSMQAFQHSNRERGAQNLRARNDKKHARNMLRYWRDRCVQRRGQGRPGGPSVLGPTVSRLGLGPEEAEDDEGATRGAEGWTAFDDGSDARDWAPGLEASSSATPMPGYLSTPSKRAVRAKALVKLTTTPRMTPFKLANTRQP
ncbi:MAG: hypothetical protein M1832_005270 [Thelocarpon impressellum]|nr:MAG: hypothetical protein M1832_005270 [Thelocarpon impressellum]